MTNYLEQFRKNGSLSISTNRDSLIEKIFISIKNGKDTNRKNLDLLLVQLFLENHEYEKAAEVCLANENDLSGEFQFLLGKIRTYQGAYGNAIERFFKALRIAQIRADLKLEGRIYTGLSTVSRFLNHYDHSATYFRKAIALSNPLYDLLNLAESHMGMGIVSIKTKKFDQAIELIKIAQQYAKSLSNLELNCSIIKAFGDTYYQSNNISKAIEKYKLALITLNQIDNLMMKSVVHIRLADCFYKENRLDAAIQKAEAGAQIAKRINFLQGETEAESLLSKLHESKGNTESAYTHLKSHVKLNEAIASKVDPSSLMREESGFLIELKENEIELLRELEVRHQEIKDSITYASKIQQAILAKDDYISLQLDEHFIMFQPKEIVSGDFYWYHSGKEKQFLMAADCTGHGVPGSLVSMLLHDMLNQLIIDQKRTDPGEILTLLNKRLHKIFKKEANKKQANDGMDVAFCIINKKEGQIDFAGAINPLLRVRNGLWEEFKADRASIGGNTRIDKSFNTSRITIEKGDWYYIYSDGFQDQFGGPKNKKFMSKNFKNLLANNSGLNKDEQLKKLTKSYKEWARDYEQIDDILVIGFCVEPKS